MIWRDLRFGGRQVMAALVTTVVIGLSACTTAPSQELPEAADPDVRCEPQPIGREDVRGCVGGSVSTTIRFGRP